MLKKGQIAGAISWARNTNVFSKYLTGQKPWKKNTSGNQQQNLIIASTLPFFYQKYVHCTAVQKKWKFFNVYKKLIYEQFYGRIKYFVAFVSQWLVLVMSVPPRCTAEPDMLESNKEK